MKVCMYIVYMRVNVILIGLISRRDLLCSFYNVIQKQDFKRKSQIYS